MTDNFKNVGAGESVNRDRGILLSPSDTYGVYVHIPFCKAKCAYCAFCSTPDLSLRHAYIDALEQEILSTAVGKKIKADTVYIGGGTPSCLYDGALTRVFNALRKTFAIDNGAEITVEINPESCTGSFIRECRDCGVNRVSMGMQSCDDGVLRAVNRLHDYKGFISAVKLLGKEGFDNISTDFILGLPEQTPDDIKKCVGVAAEYCTHASVYALTVEEGTPLFASGYRPDDDTVADMYDLACGLLKSSGFIRYEVSNFAKNGKISRHNSKYWCGVPYVGYGAAAHGYDGKRLRYAHSDNVKEYVEGSPIIISELSDTDLYNEYIMLRLRTEAGILRADFKSRFGTELDATAGETIKKLVRQGLLIDDGKSVRIAPDKMFVMNGIIEELML